MNPSGREHDTIQFHGCSFLFTARKRSCGKVMFLHLCVILSARGGGLSGSGSGRYASGSRGCTPLVTHPTGHPLPQHNPIGHWTRNPLDPQNPLDIPLWTHLRDSHPSPLRSTCGQYASYWNAFWFFKTVLC